ncbi:MAG: phosphatidylserine decarboxylase family protein [Planctomycetota bacterium]|nr:phosphatidylserine decarboxylase family protein [Planctomycetota bacterium]
MRIPLAKYGVRELLLFGGIALAATIAAVVWAWYLAILPAAALAFILAFFRDPARQVPAEPGIVVAPADGTVTEVAEVDEPQFLRCRAHKIGIFMSLVSVHVNRSPCAGRVEAVDHRAGRFLDARDPAATAENESVSMAIDGAEGRGARVLVRQVAGLLARRIVCAAAIGDRLERGEKYGMIKFGSRAEVYVPVEAGFEVAVKIGDGAKAGETILGRFR